MYRNKVSWYKVIISIAYIVYGTHKIILIRV